MPARQSFLVQMVDDRNDLSNAIAINSSMANGARLIGPAIAGLVIAAVGEGWCFLIDGVSYFAVIASLLLMRIEPLDSHRQRDQHARADARGMGLRAHVSADPHDPAAVCADEPDGISVRGAAAGFCRRRCCTAARHTLGWLTGASGVGALVSAISLAVRKSVVGLTRMLQIAAAMLGVALILFGLSHTLWLSLVLMVFVGFGLMQGAAASNTIIQSLVPEDKRARVMSYYTMAFFGVGAVRQLAGGGAGSPDRGAAHGDGHRRVLRRRRRSGSRWSCRRSGRSCGRYMRRWDWRLSAKHRWANRKETSWPSRDSTRLQPWS